MFEAAARHRNFTLAAREFNVTQPAISRMISRLEQHLGATLFLRKAGGLELTAEGRLLFRAVRDGFERIEDTVCEIESRAQDPEVVTVSVTSAFAIHWLMARFDRVSTISRRMMVRLEQKGLPPEHTYLFPNWVDTQAIFPLPDSKDSLRHELDISEEKIIVLYAGTMGAKQGLEILIHTAQLLQDKKNILFVFCGEGAARADLMNATRNFSNVKHLPLQPLEKLNLLLNTADIHIMPQKANVADLVMPSKLLGMLASGRAIVATADRNTELGQIISRVGVLISPHNTAELADVICKLADSPDQRARLGASARDYVCERWSAELVLPRFHEQLTHLTKKSR